MLGIKSKSDRQFDVLNRRLIEIEGVVKKIRLTQKEQVEAEEDRFKALRELLGMPAELLLLREQVNIIHRLVSELKPPSQPKPLEVSFVFKVANDHQDEPFSISIGGVTDAEGEPLPDSKGLTVDVKSSDDAVVGVSFDPSTNSGVASFGHSGVASLTASVTNAKGEILGSGAADFTVTTGDPAAVSDVKIAFSGITEETPEGGGTEG